MKPWIVYSLIRVGIFAACFAVLYGVAGVEGWLAAIISAAIGLCVAYIFFRPQRDKAISAIAERTPTSDETVED